MAEARVFNPGISSVFWSFDAELISGLKTLASAILQFFTLFPKKYHDEAILHRKS
jgi:hypothetical protein